MSSSLSIVSWNVRRDLPLLLAHPQFQNLIFQHDVILLQETGLWPDQQSTLLLPNGWDILSLPRPPSDDAVQASGGLCCIYRNHLDLSMVDSFSSDFMILKIQNLYIFNVYLPPESSRFSRSPESEYELYDALTTLTVPQVGRAMVAIAVANSNAGMLLHFIGRL